MRELVSILDNKAMTTSRLIADKFKKQHKDVLRAIRETECSREFGERNFAPTFYNDQWNREQTEYLITRDGFSFLVMGFTGKEAAKFKEEFIGAFNKMEKELIERASKSVIQPASPLALARQMLETMEAQEHRLTAIEATATQTAQTVHRLAAKVSDVNDNYFTLSGYHVYRGRRYELLHNEECQKGKELTKSSKMNGYRVGKAHSTKYGFVNTYHTDVLKAVLGF